MRRSADTFPSDVRELQNYFAESQPQQRVPPFPAGLERAYLAARFQRLQRAISGSNGFALRLRLAFRPRFFAERAANLPRKFRAIGNCIRLTRWFESMSLPRIQRTKRTDFSLRWTPL